MERRGSGRILAVSSTAGAFPGSPHFAVYYATKSFVFSLSQAVSKEMEGTGVTVTCLCPGPTATNFEKEANMAPENRMFTWFKPMTAQEVAQEGYDGLMKGQTIRVTKPFYRFFKFISRFGSDKLRRNMAMLINTGRMKAKK